MLTLQLLFEVTLASIVGFVISGTYITGTALQARYRTINQQSVTRTSPSPPALHRRLVDYAKTCPATLPVQFRYSPLVLIDRHGFVPIADEHLHLVNPGKPFPRKRPEKASQPTGGKITATRTTFKSSSVVQAPCLGRRTKIILLVWVSLIAVSGVLFLYAINVGGDWNDLERERRRLPDMTDEFAELTLESAFLARSTRQLKAGLEGCTKDRDHLKRVAAHRDHYQRVASEFKGLAMGMVEALVLLDSDNTLWQDLLYNGIPLPESVLTGTPSDEVPVPVDTPPS